MKQMTLISGIALSLILVGCGSVSEEVRPTPRKPAKLLKVQREPVLRSVQLPAVIEATEETVVTFQVPGLVETLDLPEGSKIKKGQIIASLDLRNFQNALIRAQADFEQADTEFQRGKNLIEQNAIARSLFDQRKTQLNKARSALNSAQKSLEDATLRAPYDAIVAKVHIEKFENIAPQQPIVTLLGASGVNAVVQVPASLVAKSETEMPVEVTLTLDAARGILMPTQLLEAAAAADPSSQTFEVRYSFKAPKGLVVLPGMTGTLTGQFEVAKTLESNEFEVPLSAIVSEAGKTFVWIVDPNSMKVHSRLVRVKPGVDHAVAISGVEQGEMLVSVGGHYLYEGAEVRPFMY